MRAVTAFLFAALLIATVAQDTDSDNDNSNAVEPKPSLRLDPFIRKALLKALSDLEDSDPTTELDSSETTPEELLRTGDEITEISPTPDTNTEVQYHSYIVDGRQAFSNSTTLNPTILRENLIISSTIGNVENQVAGTLPTPDPFSELFQTKESNNLQQVRSIKSNSLNSNSDVEERKANKEKTTTTTLPPTPSTTTTPKPTHNEDGENIEEVSNRDVQVFHAPLVAAFTVHQDALGLPRKVVPIFQQNALPPQNSANSQNNLSTLHKPVQNDFLAQQVALQQQLEQKQRVLEEQLRLLQLQQKQQEDLLRNQQLSLQNKEIQQLQLLQQEEVKKQQFLQEQQRIHQQNLLQVSELQKQQTFQNNFRLQSNNFQQSPNAVVTVQPSVSFDASNTISNQQLPNREAVDFLLHLRNQQREQFPLQQNHLPQGIANLQLPHSAINFQPQQISQQNSGGLQQPSFGNFQQQQPSGHFQPQQPSGNFQQQQVAGNFQQQQPTGNFQQQQTAGNFQQQQPTGNFQQQQPAGIFQQQQVAGNFQQQQPAGNFQQQQANFQQQPSIGFQQQLHAQNNFVPNQNFRQGNRVFRQDSGTGNFGLNSNTNQFRFGGFQPSNPGRFQPFGGFSAADAGLQQLLLQSGVNGRSQEDINIVSKVLALNHGIGPTNIVSNRLNFPFADSRRRTRKAPTRST